MSHETPILPTDRAFVVQIHVDAEADKGRLAGRVEHYVSGHATHFQSVEELVAFIAQMLTKKAKEKRS